MHGNTAYKGDVEISEEKLLASKPTQVLVAEDSEDNRFLLSAYCQESNFVLTFAEDGSQAVEAYRSGDYGVVLMDIEMPVLDGLSATRQIRLLESNERRRRTPIFALTAYAMKEDVRRAQDAGCDGHWAKPISKKTLLCSLHQACLLQSASETTAEAGLR